ncbi:hypothetical protein AVEN_41826-1 [Araneus ventricosus]|uniref:Uncharacterized protein n=1 Tax=Araneus ventricosus TaxID=182803 RepID=A0A4Y2ACU8_ARAVE|nr:hypothetical protein AVEN_41826-1 [Araneus ventricosus]
MGKISNTGSTPHMKFIIHIPLRAKITRFLWTELSKGRPELGQGGPLASRRHVGIMASAQAIHATRYLACESKALFYSVSIYSGFAEKDRPWRCASFTLAAFLKVARFGGKNTEKAFLALLIEGILDDLV